LAKQAAKEQKEQAKLESRYLRLNKVLGRLKAEYRELGIKKELNGKLTLKEEKRLALLTSRTQKLDAAFKKVDAGMGNYQRNVGNYASGWDGLGNSINQLSRELPAFANSAQTGFMAISNNLPMLFDEISRLKSTNKTLAAEGKATKSVFSQVASSIFSLGTGLSLGVTLLTLYGDDIVKFASKLLEGANSSKAFAKEMKAMQSDIAESAGQSIGQFKTLVSVIQDETASEEARLMAKKELKDSYPDFNAEILKEKENTDLVSDAITNYTDKLLMKAKAQAAMSKIQEEANKLLELQLKKEEYETNLSNKAIKQLDEINQAKAEGRELTRGELKQLRQGTSAIAKLNGFKEDEAEIQERINKFTDFYAQNLTDVADKEVKNAKAKKKTAETVKGSLPYIEEQIKLLEEEQNKVQFSSDKWVEYEKALIKAREALDKLKNTGIGETDIKPLISDAEKLNAELNNITSEGLSDEWLADLAIEQKEREVEEKKKLELEYLEFSKGIAQQLGRQTTDLLGINNANLSNAINTAFQYFEDKANGAELTTTEKIGALTNFAQSAFGVIGDIGNGIFDRNIEQIDQQIEANTQYYDNLIQQASGNEHQQDALRRDKARKEKKLQDDKRKEQIKQAKFQKAQTLLNIGLSTASAIISTLAQVPKFDFGISATALATTIGAIGAAQLAFAAAQPIPKFAEGVENFKGGLAIVGDGGRPEVVETPTGEIFKTPSTDTLVNLPKGSNVYSSEEEFKKKMYSASILTSVAIDSERVQRSKDAERLLNMQLLAELQANTRAVKASKTNVNVVQKSTDIDFNLWKANLNQWD